LPEGDFTERSEYDSKGRVVKQISFEGIIVTFNYDDQGRLKSKTYFENQVKYFTNTSSQTWTYEYDSQGRVIKINQNGRITETTYDSQGRTASIKTPEGTVSYEYDKFGRQIRVSSNKGDDIRYSYDLFGRLETVTNHVNGDVTKYEYDLVGNLSRTTTKNNISTLITTYEYDNMNHLVKETNFADKNNNNVMDEGEEISQFAYELDKQGKKISATENFWTDIDADGTLDLLANYVNWKYDNAGRLIREVFDHYDDNFDQTSEWIYDLVGNRLKQTINGKETQYNYDANDRLLTEMSGSKQTVYGYDHTQQTSKTVSENGEIVSTTTYEYDLQGRMSVVTIISGNKTEITRYEYGADGIRTSAEHEIYVDGELQSKIKTEYLNDPKSLTGYSQVLRQTEYDSEGNIIKETSYVIGHQRISQTVEIGGEKTTYYFTFDGHGSARVLLDAAMAVAQIYSFDAYGNALGFDTAEALTEFLYSGEQFDSKIGQQYLRQRYYDPATGRFNRLDPFFGNQFDPQSFHKYLYTHADPSNATDPSGKLAFFPIYVALMGIGAFFGLTGQAIVGASWAKSIHTGLTTFSVMALAPAMALPLSQLWLAHATLNLAFEYPRIYNKWNFVGEGGKDATNALKKLRDDVVNKWRNMDDDLEKLRIVNSLYTFPMGLIAWDIRELFDKEDKALWTKGLTSPAPETLTFMEDVYPIAEVNYLLWGLVNHLAYEEGIAPVFTNWVSMQGAVLLYRSIGGFWSSVGQNLNGVAPLFETTSGKMAWARFGWNWLNEEWPAPPTSEAVANATPNSNRLV
jgi:RHS repeat-associated protein